MAVVVLILADKDLIETIIAAYLRSSGDNSCSHSVRRRCSDCTRYWMADGHRCCYFGIMCVILDTRSLGVYRGLWTACGRVPNSWWRGTIMSLNRSCDGGQQTCCSFSPHERQETGCSAWQILRSAFTWGAGVSLGSNFAGVIIFIAFLCFHHKREQEVFR